MVTLPGVDPSFPAWKAGVLANVDDRAIGGDFSVSQLRLDCPFPVYSPLSHSDYYKFMMSDSGRDHCINGAV